MRFQNNAIPENHPVFFFFGGGGGKDWALNSGFRTCKARILPLEPHL
jgi:hypothetical protein